jgi:hypothetical protein
MVNRDFSDLFAAFNEAGVRYLLVGAHAVAFHAEPRYTKDLDVWVEATPDNAVRVIAALGAFGAPLADVTESDFSQPGVTCRSAWRPIASTSRQTSMASASQTHGRTGWKRPTAGTESGL